MNLSNIHTVYFIGVGGIGMSAIARYFKANHKNVLGYDKTQTEITNDLVNLDIKIYFKDDISLVNNKFDVNSTLVIYTPAVPRTHKQLTYFIDNDFKVLKRSEILGIITQNTYCLAVAGTHGKTTTTSILGHLLKECNVAMTAFLGGISENYNSNLILNGSKVSVVEADEFDRSFLTLSPDLACITSMDADHLDIYGDVRALHQSFEDFSKKIKPKGKLFVKNGLPIKGITYGLEDNSDYSAENIKIKNGTYFFDVKTPKGLFRGFEFSLPGRHNLSNALIAIAMAIEFGCSINQLIVALSSYRGVKRRFSYQIKNANRVLIDDYAHHPTEIKAVYNAVKEMYPNDKVLVLFQPHLFSRTRDFIEGFACSLSLFDQIMLLDIYPAREAPIEGVNSQWLLDKIENKNKELIKKNEIVSKLKNSNARVVLAIGAGDIGEEVSKIKEALM